MIRNRKFLKGLAVFLILEITSSTILPTVSWALTAGPTAPEATSFEPVDTTDMVNLMTGDFVYNIPLLEVPGPSGGYPLSLSYHAGIQTDLDASWVGLGWTLNPGAINRSVNGYADDYENIMASDRVFWQGGTATSFTIGVNIGNAGGGGVSAGLVFADDTYKGSGTGYYYGAGMSESIAPGTTANLNHTRGVSPYGESYSNTDLSVGVGVSTQSGMSASANVGVSFDQDGNATGHAGVGISYRSSPAISGSLSTSGKGSFSVGGLTARAHNSKSGQISTRGYNYSGDIPTPWGFSVRLGKSYQRYWIDETESVGTYGSLYFPQSQPTSLSLDNKAFDVYDLQNPELSLTEPLDENIGGAFADYDSYTVLGQGIGGGIRPFHYKSYLLRQNKKNGNKYRTKSYFLGSTKRPTFRFIGDFSNRYEHDMMQDVFQSDASNPLSLTFNGNKITGESGSDGYHDATGTLPGSRDVQWCTNRQIKDATRTDEEGQPVPLPPDAAISRGFIDCKALGFTRDDNSQIGGFKVTNESGITYHYSLPVYSYLEHQYTGRVDEQNIHHYNTYTKPNRYAYTWLLTAVTGPDYVDKNSDGLANDADWGYWVTFNYGKWSSAYSWRNPGAGFNKDLDQSFNTFAKGKKEVYYLNSIQTKTHTAFFVKEIRADGKGVVHELESAVGSGGGVTNVDKGSFSPLTKISGGNSYTEYPVSTLRLHSIYLVQNKDMIDYEPTSSFANSGTVYHHSQHQVADLGKNTYGRNVIDIHDLGNYSVVRTKCLKKIEFKTDYSLCPGTPNSYRSALDVLNTSETTSGKLGKLTLKALSVQGRGEANLIPEIKFNYGRDEVFIASIVSDPSAIRNQRLSISNFEQYDFKKGEIIRFDLNPTDAYGYVLAVDNANHELQVRMYEGLHPYRDYLVSGARHNLKFHRTKNPPYSQEAHDLWGLYKSDYILPGDEYVSASENVKRMTTSISAASRDAWSLREITTALGAKVKVEYESDIYKSALKSLSNIPIKDIAESPGGKTKVTLYEDVAEYGLTTSSMIKFSWITALRYEVHDPGYFENVRFDCNGEKTYMYQWYPENTYANYDIQIESIEGNSFVIDHNFKERYPDPEATGVGFKKTPDYDEEHFSESAPSGINPLRGHLIPSAPIFLGGEVLMNHIFTPYGGDLRVKKLSIDDTWGKTRSTLYEYFNGITPYEPLGFAVPIGRITENIYSCLRTIEQRVINDYRQQFFDGVYKRFGALFANSRELPGPGVMYEWVRVTEEIEDRHGKRQFEGKAEYQFEVFSPKTIDIGIGGGSANNPLYGKIASTSFGSLQHQTTPAAPVLDLPVHRVVTSQGSRTQVKDFTAIMGSLKRVVLYGKNNLKISETTNEFLHDDFDNYLVNLQGFKNQGTVAETFADARIIVDEKTVPTDPDKYTLYGIIAQKIRYPSIQTGQTTINYKTGIETRTDNLAFDFYSGGLTKTRITDGYGNTLITESMPAYRYYSEMGLAYAGYKNMLTQQAYTRTYTANGGLLSAGVQTWSKSGALLDQTGANVLEPSQYKVWRTDASYSWLGTDRNLNGQLYPLADISPFNFVNPAASSAQWQKNGETTLRDIYSHTLEVADVNGNYATTKMSADQVYVYATAANAGYHDIAFSGAEDKRGENGMFGGNVSAGGAVTSENAALSHTGYKSLRLNPSATGFTYEVSKAALKNKNGAYHASVWVKENTPGSMPNVSLIAETNGSAALPLASTQTTRKAGGWRQVEIDFNLPAATDLVKVYVKNNSSQEIYIDDFRVHPVDAPMVSYVYNQWGEVSHVLDNNNLYTRYEYDGMGRLKRTFKESFSYPEVKLSEVIYHYKGQ